MKATDVSGMPTNAMMPMHEVDQGMTAGMIAALFSRSRASALPPRSVSAQSWAVSMSATTWSQATAQVTMLVTSTLANGVAPRATLFTNSVRPSSNPVPSKMPA